MTLIDSYKTVASETSVETKIKGSRFIGQIYKCNSPDKARKILDSIRRKYYDATHHCYAWQTGIDAEMEFKYSDDGEPNGTAGRPIFDQLSGADLTDVIVIVTRYYGGTKLGTGGLTHAYSDSAADAIKKAGNITKYITGNLNLELDFSDYGSVERLIMAQGGKIVESAFEAIVKLRVEIRLSKLGILKDELIDLTSGRIKIAQ